MLGLQFWQGGELQPRYHEQTAHGTAVRVELHPLPFDIWFPSIPENDPELRLIAWRDDTVFGWHPGESLALDPAFGAGHGMAQSAYGDGSLILNLEGFNYFCGTRIEPAETKRYSRVYVSQISELHGADTAMADLAGEDLFVISIRDKNTDDAIDGTEFELIRLCFT